MARGRAGAGRRPGPASDVVGLATGALAGCCWAAYILRSRLAGAGLPGLQAPAVASALCALGHLPVLVVLSWQGRLTGAPLLAAMAAGVLSAAVPYAADLAALVGMVLLGQFLAVPVRIGIGVVVLANVAALAGAAGRTSGATPAEVAPLRAEVSRRPRPGGRAHRARRRGRCCPPAR